VKAMPGWFILAILAGRRQGGPPIPGQFEYGCHPIAVVKDSTVSKQAQVFVDYVLGPTGQEVLTRYGFISQPGRRAGHSVAEYYRRRMEWRLRFQIEGEGSWVA
jgi:hypothetical protein